MQIGMIGMGRMGGDMVRRLLKSGHECVIHDANAEAMSALRKQGAIESSSLEDFVSRLQKPRIVWLMLPAAAVDRELAALLALLEANDIVIDGGNSYYHDDIRRGAQLQARGIHYVDVGTSGGIFGLEKGYCLMIGGASNIVQFLDPIFTALAPGAGAASAAQDQTVAGHGAQRGYLHCGPHGAGHFVKMVHNGIEYGIMAAYAEGLNILRNANAGMQAVASDAETTPLRTREHYQYELDLPEIAEVWRHGSVIGSWLLDLTAAALRDDPQLTQYTGRVSDSGEGRWTIIAAIDEAVPTPVLSAALYERFGSRGDANFANKILSAMRHAFGGHLEKTAPRPGP